MKRIGIWAGAIALLYVLQSSVIPYIALYGTGPDFLLLFVASFSFLRGGRLGVCLGFFVGLLQDLATGTFFGIDIFSKMLVGFATGFFSERIFKEQTILPIMNSLWATLSQYFTILLFVMLLGYHIEPFYHIRRVLPIAIIYNALFALPVHRLVYMMCEKLLPEKTEH